MSAELVIFYCFAALTLFGAVAMVAFVRNVIAGILSLVVTMISLSGIFVLLDAEFVGVVQIMVYAGAIMVLLLFVVMLFNLEMDEFGPEPIGRGALKLVAAAAAALFGVVLIGIMSDGATQPAAPVPGLGGHRAMGLALFTDHVLPLEVTGLLLLGAIVGAVILAKRRIL